MKLNILIAFFLITSFAKAADSLLLQIPVQASFFTTDNLQNIYFVNEKDEIVKYEWQTQETFTYSNKQLGKPVYIDAKNPMKVVVLYADLNTAVWLDNTLSAIQTVNFNTLPDKRNYLAKAICKSDEDNAIWIFDALSNKIIKLDERGNTLILSEAFTDMFSAEYIPQQLFYDEQTLYVNCTDDQILLFDAFANFERILDIESAGIIQYINKKFIYLKTGMLHITEGNLYNTNRFVLPGEEALQAELENDKLYIRTGSGISVYSSAY